MASGSGTAVTQEIKRAKTEKPQTRTPNPFTAALLPSQAAADPSLRGRPLTSSRRRSIPSRPPSHIKPPPIPALPRREQLIVSLPGRSTSRAAADPVEEPPPNTSRIQHQSTSQASYPTYRAIGCPLVDCKFSRRFKCFSSGRLKFNKDADKVIEVMKLRVVYTLPSGRSDNSGVTASANRSFRQGTDDLTVILVSSMSYLGNILIC
nr:uncharacterized protein LOC123494814 [Aegilops tauschii subsp. strangulata]